MIQKNSRKIGYYTNVELDFIFNGIRSFNSTCSDATVNSERLIMPTYTRHCLKCDEIFDKMVRMDEKHSATVVCPYCDSTEGEWMITSTQLVERSDRLMGKSDTGFTQVLQKIQERNPRTTICER